MGRTLNFECKADDGTKCTIVVTYQSVDTSDLADPSETETGLAVIRTKEGGRVRPIEKGVYQLQSGVIVRTSDPNAP